MAIEAQNSKFFWSATTANSTAVPVLEITGFSGPGGSAAVIDITNLLSTAKEKLPGLWDEGQLTLDLNFNRGNAGQASLMTDRAARTKKNATLKLSDTAVATFDGYCLGFSITGTVDDKVTANAVIEITGAVTWA